jgi:hypothetical protein
METIMRKPNEHEYVMTFLIGPVEGDPLCNAHVAEAERQGAEFYNFGWFQDDDCLCSKTDKGILSTEWNDVAGWRHQWRRS